MLRRMALIRTDISEELIASIIRATIIGDLGATLAVSSYRSTHIVFLHSFLRVLGIVNFVPSSPILVTLMMVALRSSETSAVTRAALRNIPGDCILISLLYFWVKLFLEIYFSIMLPYPSRCTKWSLAFKLSHHHFAHIFIYVISAFRIPQFIPLKDTGLATSMKNNLRSPSVLFSLLFSCFASFR
jgi:hypothetical protein